MTSRQEPPKVAIFGQLLPGSAGGIETNLLQLLAALGSGNAPGGEQVVIGPGGESDWLLPHLAGGQTTLAWPPLRCDPPAQGSALAGITAGAKDVLRRLLRRGTVSAHSGSGKALSTRLRQLGVEVLHFPYQRYFPTPLPFIFEPWDLQHLHLPELFAPAEIEFRNWLYRRACEDAALVVTATRWTKKDLVRWFGLPPTKIAVIPRGSPLPGGVPRDDDRVGLLASLPERFALYPAKTWSHKNHSRLFRALALLRDSQGLAIPLVCTGKPVAGSEAALSAELAALGLDGQVHFTGYVDDAAMQALYRQAEMMVFPSLFEGLGIPLLEAMAAGVPVACSNASCLPEVGGGAVEYFDPLSVEAMAGAIAQVWSSPQRRADLRRQGPARAAEFNWAGAAESFRVAYAYVAGRRLTPAQADTLAAMLR